MRPLTCAFVAVMVVVCSAGLKTRGSMDDTGELATTAGLKTRRYTSHTGQRGAAPPATTQAPNPNAAPPEAGTGAISGVAIDGTTKTPLPGVVVYLGPPNHGPPGGPLRQLTDAKGRFVFRGLPAHNGYFINASKFGYFDGHYGRGSSGALGARITLADGQWFSEANLTMWRPAAIGGRVVDQVNEPVVGVFVRVLAKVLIAGREHLVAGQVATTDDRGVYRIANLAPGTYVVQVPSVQATLPATLPVSAGRAAGPAIDPSASLPTLDGVDGYRLLLGRYVTPLPPENGRARVYPPTFFPGTPNLSSAVPLDLAYGADRAGVDIRVEPVPTVRISGRLDGPLDTIAAMPLRLLPAGLEELGDGSEAATTVAAADGAFTFLNVPTGTYTLEARRSNTQFESRPIIGATTRLPGPIGLGGGGGSGGGSVLSAPSGITMSTRTTGGGDQSWARVPLDVGRADVSDLVVSLRPAVRMRGRFVWEGAKPPTVVSLRLEPANGDPTLGVPRWSSQGDGADTFVIDGLMPGEYIVSALGYRMKSTVWNGRDYTNRPFDASAGRDFDDVVITLTDQVILVTGSVRDDRGAKSADDPAVIVFPVESDLWSNFGFGPARVKAIQTTNAGRYTFQSLPAGEYYIVAVDGEHIDGWKDPSFLKRAAPLAAKIALAWGDKVEHALRVVTIK